MYLNNKSHLVTILVKYEITVFINSTQTMLVKSVNCKPYFLFIKLYNTCNHMSSNVYSFLQFSSWLEAYAAINAVKSINMVIVILVCI